MLRSLTTLSLAALMLLVPPVIGQDTANKNAQFEAEITAEEKERFERFDLFNSCKPVYLWIGELPDSATAIGLTEEALQAAAESRLRIAQLYTEDASKSDYALLSVAVAMGSLIFDTTVSYKKALTDAFGVTGLATTWNSRTMITFHEGKPSLIVSDLSQHLDKFLAAYLRVNEEACEESN